MNETIADTSKLTLPCLVMVGSGDGIVDSSATQEFFRKVASPDKTLKVYDGFYHELFSEPEKEALLSEMSGWISTRI
jgi:alpha-beta hydrolase superfamily lysophospholipase